MQTENLLIIELQLSVQGSNNLILLKKKGLKNFLFSWKPALESSSDGQYWPGLLAPMQFFTN